MIHRLVLLCLLSLCSSFALAATPCVGEAGIVCKSAPIKTVLTAETLALPTVTIPIEPGLTAHIDLLGPGTFVTSTETVSGGALLGENSTKRVYLANSDLLSIDGFAVQLTDAYLGDKLRLHIRVINPNGAGNTVMEAYITVVEVIGFSRLEVPMFNPGSNPNQQAVLRLTNPTSNEGAVAIYGIDDLGQASETVQTLIPAGGSIHLTSLELEMGQDGLVGAMGNGEGKWRLIVDADFHGLVAQAFIRAPDGSLNNLSSVID